MSKLAGGCLCGAIRYELSGRLRLPVSCHCRECQYVSGGGPAHAMVMRAEGVTITNGRAKEYWTISARGGRVARLFCANCGTPLFAKTESHPEFLAVKAGSLDEPWQFRPNVNIWTKSAQPWHYLDRALPRFKQDPELDATAILELARASVVKIGSAMGLGAEGDRGP
jgi:hypothetical protein